MTLASTVTDERAISTDFPPSALECSINNSVILSMRHAKPQARAVLFISERLLERAREPLLTSANIDPKNVEPPCNTLLSVQSQSSPRSLVITSEQAEDKDQIRSSVFGIEQCSSMPLTHSGYEKVFRACDLILILRTS